MDEDKRKKLEQWYDRKYSLHDSYCSKVKDLIESIIKSRGIPFQSISSRVKEKESFLSKCDNDKYSDPTNEIMDIIGIRIIAYTNSDVKAICKIIEKEFSIDPDNSENKADKLKENEVGYLSIHYIARLSNNRAKLAEYVLYKELRCEIQVRTLLQHTWAEIEHDRNYKFSGVLPNEIRRRFFLLAGTLEMLDREFQNLSDDIDKYREEVKGKAIQGKLNISIDSTSLFEYMSSKFNEDWVERSFGKGGKIIIEELTGFGMLTLQNLDKIIPKDFARINKELNVFTNYTGLLRDIMIINNYKKYFDKCWKESWNGLDDKTHLLYESYNLPIDKIMSKYKIVPENEEEIFIPEDDFEPFETDDDFVPIEIDDDDFEPFEVDDDSELFESDDELIS